MMVFSDTSGGTGGVQQVRSFMRVDSNQWPTSKIVNSFNNYLDRLTGYAIGADKRFQWDNTNHTKLPEGVTDLTSDQTDYSFLTDEQGNQILTLTGMSLIDANGLETRLIPVDRDDMDYDQLSFGKITGTPTRYDKIADNIVRLDYKPSATDAASYDLKFYFQRSSPYYVATDTTKTSGFSPILDRGFVMAGAFDGALTLGLPNLQPLSIEMQKEEQFMKDYFTNRNNDSVLIMKPVINNSH
jgi:hypothetical protein